MSKMVSLESRGGIQGQYKSKFSSPGGERESTGPGTVQKNPSGVECATLNNTRCVQSHSGRWDKNCSMVIIIQVTVSEDGAVSSTAM